LPVDNVDTIFALSSGSPPAGIALVRISGPHAGQSLTELTGRALPKPRMATLRLLRDPKNGIVLDQGLALWFPGPESATGEDIAELHLHGGRAVVAAILQTLSERNGLRHAEPGEFTRRAFENGRIDLAEAEGLGDLLSAETEAQRRHAIAQVGGALHRLTDVWVQRLLGLSARVEAAIDFSDEDDVAVLETDNIRSEIALICTDIQDKLANPPAERLHDGLRVAIIGPPNSGKSTLLNRLISREAAIVSPIPGTTRDVIEAPVRVGGLSLVIVDTAGIRDSTDPIEKLGVERSLIESQSADIILALGGWQAHNAGSNVIHVSTKSDLGVNNLTGLSVSAKTGAGMDVLIEAISAAAQILLPAQDQVALNFRHREMLRDALSVLSLIAAETNELLIAEHLRLARNRIGSVTGGVDAEAMLDILFGSFCIGK
jgi:tRNA modification GTPase